MAGKGSAPRKGANQKAYEANWENIFGKKNEKEITVQTSGQAAQAESARQVDKQNNEA